MTQRRMEQITVSVTTEGLIEISQETDDPEADHARIKVSPEQVDVLAKWLNEAREELDHSQ